MNREIKFRFWEKLDVDGLISFSMNDNDGKGWKLGCNFYKDTDIAMQYTGLKDKNGLQEVYEGDIIDEYGNIKGNIYEMDAGETDFIIQGFGDKNWGATYQNAVDRGCKDSE